MPRHYSRVLAAAWNLPDRHADEAPGHDGTCPTCVAERDRLMSLDHDLDVIAAADPETLPGHDYATQAEADLFLPDVIEVPCGECFGMAAEKGWPCACQMAGVKA